MSDWDILSKKEEYMYRFDFCGQRCYVCAFSISDAVEQIRDFDPWQRFQRPELYRRPYPFSRRRLRRVGPRTLYRNEVYMNLKCDAPDHFFGGNVSPLPKGEMYRRFHSLIPAYYD